jgi:iron complex outermembrane receptor protein
VQAFRAGRCAFGLFLLWLAGQAAHGQAAQSPPASQGDLTQVSIESLMNMEVTSVSKKEQKLSQVAAAIFVITQEEIRRSGATNIPDLLRMVPGLDVGQINANTWAISARGFNHELADKLLVLVDGRAVYTPINAGVNWDTQDVPLEDIERIEVIRGPGGTVWGANAVNGVINIITSKTADTQGALVALGGGTTDQEFGTTQYGGRIGKNTSYRVFAKYLNHDHSPDLLDDDEVDDWHLLHGGFRADTDVSKKDSLAIQGDLYTGSEGASIVHIASIVPPDNVNVASLADLSGGNILSRWKHTFSNRSDTTLQFYFDRYTRHGPENDEGRNTVDFDFQHHLDLGGRNDLIWGAGYRRSADQTAGTIDLAFVPASRTIDILSWFAQDEITLKPDRVFLTVGTKLEHNDFTTFEIQPSVRVTWSASSIHTIWAAVSRASRTPSRLDTASDIGLAVFPGPNGFSTEAVLFGNPRQKAEHVVAAEVGYRAQPSRRFSVDVATFFNVYDNLRTREPGALVFEPTPVPARWIFPITWDTKMHGTTDGIEVSTDWKATNRWTLSPGYALLQMHLHADAASQDTTSAPGIEGSNPRHQAQLRSHVDLGRGLGWDTSVYFVERLSAQQIPSYTRVDTQLRWRFAEQLELSLVGQNLVRNHHPESNDTFTIVNSSEVKRSAYGKVTWRF